jgi:hypothetical protein
MAEAERVGLCARCRRCQRVQGARSTFYLCALSFTDRRFQKYPALPVVSCPGFEPDDELQPESKRSPSEAD